MLEIPISKRKIKKNLAFRAVNKLKREIEWMIINNNIYKEKIKKQHPINTPGKVLWCNPSLISSIVFNYQDEDPHTQLSSVEDGEWDNKFMDITELNIYKALYEYIINNKSFKETKFYNPNIKSKTEWERNSTWEYIAEFNYEKRLTKIKNLIDNIKTEGYKTQTQLGGNPRDEIIIKIGRDGKIFLYDGIHRFCISKILGIKKIPAIVKARHGEWNNLKNLLYDYAKFQHKGTKHEGKLYQKLAHPDLEDIPYVHDNDDRLFAIQKNIITKNGTVLDIGANFGFFSIKLSELGYKCTLIEQNNQLVFFLKKFNKMLDNHFNLIQKNFLNMYDEPIEYDVVLALNIFHHFLKTETSYNKFIYLLKNLKVKEMFFEPHNPNENQFRNSYKNLNNEEFIKLIINNTNLNNYKKILDCFENRYLYHLW